ncbi:MAG: BLUF domain-containing protein [Betaproteobacteria bacterium]|nr:BLUF domain-containing protein [Betaproteobacteria bacterium]
MSYTQLVYESQASDSLVEADVLDILKKSQTRNNQAGISGLLLFQGGRFLQFIEGRAVEVERLFERISQDSRHREIRTLVTMTGDRLLMPTWAMAYTSPTLDHTTASEAFTLTHRQALAICELLPTKIAGHFINLLAGEPGVV